MAVSTYAGVSGNRAHTGPDTVERDVVFVCGNDAVAAYVGSEPYRAMRAYETTVDAARTRRTIAM